MKNKRLFIFFSLIILCDILNSIRYSIHNIEDYYIPTFLVLGIFIGYAFYSVSLLIPKKLSSVFLFLAPCFCLLPFLTNYYPCNRDRDFYSYDYGMNILRPLQNNGILLIMGDTFAFPLWYLHFVERARDDVSLIDKLELRYDWYCEQMKEMYPNLGFAYTESKTSSPELIGPRFLDIVSKNGKTRPIYVPLPFAEEARAGYDLIPEGICHRIISKGASFLEIKRGEFSFKIRDTAVFMEERTRNNWDNYFISYEGRAGFLAERGFYDEAIGYYHKALALDGKRPVSLYSLGLVYKDKGELDEAEKIFKELGDRADGHYGLGMVYQKRGNLDKAILSYKKAVELDPEKIFLHHSLGAVLLEMGRYEEAISCFKSALAYQPNDPNTYYNLAVTYWKAGKTNEAI
ncbi:MAG: tetratricopeptide repeat protein, partial [Candidatus Desantisbacteria bacterium]